MRAQIFTPSQWIICILTTNTYGYWLSANRQWCNQDCTGVLWVKVL